MNGADDHDERPCVQCGEPVPAGRSVCPACGTLQRGTSSGAGARYEPAPRQPGRGGPGQPGGAPTPSTVSMPQASVPPVAPMAPATTGRAAKRRRSSSAGPILAVVVVVGLIAAVIGGAIYLDQRDEDSSATKGSGSSANAGASGTAATSSKGGDADDPRPDLVRGYCDDPRPLTGPGTIAAFKPGAGTVAFVQFPQPASSTEEAGERVVQVSPTIGKPNLSLDASINLVSLAVCVDQTGSRAVTGTCDYDLTNPSSVGESETAKLLKTTYRVRLIELRTGKVLARGTVDTPTDRCPDYAYIGGKGVSNPMTEELILGWIGEHLVNGQPT